MARHGSEIRFRTVAAALLVIAVACTTSGPAAPAPEEVKSLGTVTLRHPGDWQHLDPSPNPSQNLAGGVESNILFKAFYDSLAYWMPNPKTGKPTLVPYVASSWKATPTTFSYVIRKDVTCADGSAITPSVVKASYDRWFKSSVGVSNYASNPATTVADDAAGTFTITLQKPFSDAIYGLHDDTTGPKIICPAGLAAPLALANTPQGSGPFVLEKAVHGESVTVKRNDNWKWGPNGMTAKDLPERVVYKIVSDQSTAANLLLTGGLDVADMTGPNVPRLLADSSLSSQTTNSHWNYVLQLNSSPTRPTGDIKVREAIASAVDPAGYAKAGFDDRAKPSPSYLMPTADCFDPSTADLQVKNPSPEKAKQVLLNAGWTLNSAGKLVKDGKPLTLSVVGALAIFGSAPEYVVSQLDKAGITINAQIVERRLASNAFGKSDFDVYIGLNPADLPDPMAIGYVFSGPLPPAGRNTGQAVDPAVDAEIAAARAAPADSPERCRHYANMQKMVLKNFRLVPMASPITTWFSRGVDHTPAPRSTDPKLFRRAK